MCSIILKWEYFGQFQKATDTGHADYNDKMKEDVGDKKLKLENIKYQLCITH